MAEEDIPEAIRAWHPFYIAYPDYTPQDYFTSWLSGYEARVQSTFGFNADETDKIHDEVVRSIPGKLAVGSALDAYYRLDNNEQMDYNCLVARLTEEFIDPRARKSFNKSMSFNVRRKSQSLQDFAEEIKKDVKRYSYIDATVYLADGTLVSNPEREKNGVRRFTAGIRDKNGQKDADLKWHLEYHLQDEDELTWERALEVATRYETTFDDMQATEAAPNDDSEDDSDDGLGAAALKTSSKSKGKDTLSSIAKLARENQARISNLEFAQERMASNQEAINATLEQISIKLDFILAENDHEQQQQLQQPQLDDY